MCVPGTTILGGFSPNTVVGRLSARWSRKIGLMRLAAFVFLAAATHTIRSGTILSAVGRVVLVTATSAHFMLYMGDVHK